MFKKICGTFLFFFCFNINAETIDSNLPIPPALLEGVLNTICSEYARNSEYTETITKWKTSLKGGAGVELPEAIRKFIDAGFNIEGVLEDFDKYKKTKQENVQPHQIRDELQAVRDCRYNVWKDLLEQNNQDELPISLDNHIQGIELFSELGDPQKIKHKGEYTIYTFVNSVKFRDIKSIFLPYKCIVNFGVKDNIVEFGKIERKDSSNFFKNSKNPCDKFERVIAQIEADYNK